MPEIAFTSHDPLYTQDSTVRLTAFGSNHSQGSGSAELFENVAVRQPGGEDELYPVPSTSPRISALQPLQRRVTNGTEQIVPELPGYMPATPFSVASSNAPPDPPYPR